jgi:hypothetical protein
MSNQQKSELVNDIFRIQCFWGGHGEILQKTKFIQEGAICPEMLIQQPVEFPTAVTHKLLTIWSRLVAHQKAKTVVYKTVFGTSRVSANPRLETEDPFCRYSVQKQN